MNRKMVTHLRRLLLLVLFQMILIQGSWSITIVNFPLTANNQPAAGFSAGNGGSRVTATTTTGGTITYDSDKGASATGWNAIGRCWVTTAINTAMFSNLSLTAQMNSESASPNFGPRDFKIQYSIANGSWLDIQQLDPLTSILFPIGTINLPNVCSFKTNIRIRFYLTSTQNINDPSGSTIKNTAKSYIKELVISGEDFGPPTTQSSNISVVAMTPTSISVDCSPGTGTNRLIVINKTNAFTSPADDFTPSSINTTYSASEQQYIYDGTGSSVTVAVGSSKSSYYFRVFDYNKNLSQKRYQTSTDIDNPKLSQLENITLPTVSTIKLTTAVVGGTISSPASGTITESGVFWSISPNVTVYDQKIVAPGTGIGAFSISGRDLPRSSATIYMKAYVNNTSGISLSQEISFSNIPVFTGTGSWENASLWNVMEVPGMANSPTGSSSDSPEINGQCTLNSNTVVLDLKIYSAGKLIISPAASLTIDGIITNNASNAGLLIKSSANLANGSLLFNYPASNPTVPATVEMYSKASTADGKNHWQYFGIPVTSARIGDAFTGGGDRVRKYYEANIDPDSLNYGLWRPYDKVNPNSAKMGPNEILVPMDGYEVVQPAAKTYTFTGNLNIGDRSHSLAYTSGADWAGQNIVANPFAAAIEISELNFGSAEQAIFLYNTGSLAEWTSNSGGSNPGSNPGTYAVSSGAFAGIFGTPSRIPSMQGFLVKTSGPTTLGIPYSAVRSNNKPQRAPKASASEIVSTMIDVVGINSSDRMWIFTYPACTRKFDNGFDGRKMLGSALNTQLFAMEEDDDYQINAIKDINNTYLGFQAGNEKSLKLIFTHLNLSSTYAQLYLVDLEANVMTDITASGTEYTFTAVSTPTPVKRFKILTSTTDVTSPNVNLKVFTSKGKVLVQNSSDKTGNIAVYTMAGIAVRNVSLTANGLTTVSDLQPGVYIAKINADSERITERLIIP